MRKNSLERLSASRILRAIRNNQKDKVEYYYGLYREHYNYKEKCADHQLHKRINTHYSNYMVKKYTLTNQKNNCRGQTKK